MTILRAGENANCAELHSSRLEKKRLPKTRNYCRDTAAASVRTCTTEQTVTPYAATVESSTLGFAHCYESDDSAGTGTALERSDSPDARRDCAPGSRQDVRRPPD